MELAFKTRLELNNKQRTYCQKAAGVARFCWNWGLAEWNRQYDAGGKPSGMALKKQLNAIKKAEFPWMYEVTKYASQQPFIFLQRAFSEWFKDIRSNKSKPLRKQRPRFKKKGKSQDSFYVGGDQVKIKGRQVKIPNLGWVTMAEPVKYGGHINAMTISRQADKWFVSFSIQVDMSVLPSKSQACTGVDLGIKALATISSGAIREWHSPKPLKVNLRKLARYQRRLAKKEKGSKSYQRLVTKIAKLHKRIADIRQNTLHQLTFYLSTHFAKITIEDLNVRGMMANGKLARAVADVGMYEFRRQLTYKMQWRCGDLVVADRWYPSSKLCSQCDHKHTALKLSDRVFHCPACGLKIDRDFNASVNLEQY